MKDANITVDDWQPTAYDIKWTQEMIRTMKDGSLWKLPSSGNTYKLDKSNKTLDLVEGKPDEIFSRNFLCFGKIGYLVRDCRGDHPVESLSYGTLVITPDGKIPNADNSIVIDFINEDEQKKHNDN